MNTIVPAIIPQSFDHLKDACALFNGIAPEVQIDIVDGRFVPFTSWPYRGGSSVMLLRRPASQFEIEVDLMIERPEEAIPYYLDAGVRKVVVHLESTEHLERIYALKGERHFLLGLSISNETPLERLLEEISHADYVQLMGIRTIGSQGQPFDTEVLNRIAVIHERFPHLLISIDGSVNAESLPRLREAGARRFVAGSALFSTPDPQGAYRTLTLL